MADRFSFFARFFGRDNRAAGQKRAPRQVIRRNGSRAEYDGATTGRRAAGWRRTQRDANAELTPAVMAALRGVARDLVRNNPYAARGVAAIAENIVGTGITFQVYRDGKIDATLNALAREHFDKSNCDALGGLDLYGLQLQAARCIVESGEVLVRRRWRRRADKLPLPMQLQVLEPDYIDSSHHGTLSNGGGYLLNGIQYSPIGKRTGYWLFNGHPGSAKLMKQGSAFISASDIAHVFRADRPEQERGVTWFAPVILRMKDFGDYEDAQLTRQKIASAYAGFVTGDPETAAVTEKEDAVAGGPEPLDYIESGSINYLVDGQEITFPNPPSVDGYIDYAKVSHRAIATGLSTPYEIITGDLSNVSFISGRLGRLEFKRSVATWQWLMFIPRFCGAVERWFLEAAEMEGHNIRGVTMRWTPPRTEMLDPATEVPANRDAIRSGQKTPSQVVRENGDDPDTFFQEMADDFARLDKLKLILDSDPRHVSQVGNAVQTQPQQRSREGK